MVFSLVLVINRTIRLGKADVKLDTTIKNIGVNTAYQTSLMITLPKGISVSYIKLANSVSPLQFRPIFLQPTSLDIMKITFRTSIGLLRGCSLVIPNFFVPFSCFVLKGK